MNRAMTSCARRVGFAIVAAIAALLTACGGGDDGVVGTGLTDAPGAGAVVRVSGAAEKGPFVKGSEVMVSRLNADGGSSTATTLSEIQDDLGTFTFQASVPGPVLIVADGYHWNELTGTLSQGRLVLRAVYNVTAEETQTAYVNVLTHLTYKRTQVLMAQGIDVAQVLSKAESDVLRALRSVLPVTEISNFTQLSIYDLDASRAVGNAYVLALSAAVYQAAMTRSVSNVSSVDAELSVLLNELAGDIADDGEIDNATQLAALSEATRRLRPDLIRAILEKRSVDVAQKMLPVADMDLFIDTDGDSIVNAQDEDDDNDGMRDGEDASPYVYSEPPTLFSAEAYSNLTQNEPFSLVWTVGEEAKQIEVQVARDRTFADVIFSQLALEFQATLSLESGVYYARARAQNERGAWGPWSAGDELAVDAFARMNNPGGVSYASGFVPTDAMLASDGALVTLGNYSIGQSIVAIASVDQAGGGLFGALPDLTGKVESLIETTGGAYAFIVRSDGAAASFPRAQLAIFHHENVPVPGPSRLSRVDLLEPGLLGGSIGPATLLPVGDGVTIGTTKKWQQLLASGETKDFATPFVAKYDGDAKLRWSFDFATTAASGGELTGFWRSADGNYQVAGLLANNGGLFLATLARDGSRLLALNTTDLPTAAGAGSKALPTSDGGYIVLPGDAAGDVYKIDRSGAIQYTRSLRTLCDCQVNRVSAFVDGDTLAFGGGAAELDGAVIAEGENRPLLVTEINTATGERTQRRIYSLNLDWVRAELGEVGGSYRYSLDSFRRSPGGRILALGSLRSSAGDYVAPILVKSDPTGVAPSVLRNGAFF